MSDITLSPRYGVNPTIPVCFWCGEETGEIVLMGHVGDGRKHEDVEMPMHMILNYEPCEECQKMMDMGITVMEATDIPNEVSKVELQRNVYPTGRWVVIKPEAAQRVFDNIGDAKKLFLDRQVFGKMFGLEVSVV